MTITVNGTKRDIQSSADTPLLYVLATNSTWPARSSAAAWRNAALVPCCWTEEKSVPALQRFQRPPGKEVTTLEGLPARWAKQKNLSAADAAKTLHPVQEAWIEEQTPLCGFCQSGMMIKATELLEKTPNPTISEIKAAFTTSGPSAHLCRCGSYVAIVEAVRYGVDAHGERRC